MIGLQPDHRGADTHAGETVFTDRRVDDSLGSEPFEQPLAHLVSAVVFSDFFAHQEDVRIARQLFGERFVERLAVSDFSHALASVHVGVIVKFFERRLGAFLGKFYAGQSGLLRLLVHLVELLVRQLLFAGELRAQARDRIVQPIFLQLFFCPIARGIGHGMAAITIRSNFRERRMRILANRVDDLGQLVAHFAKVHPVDHRPGNIVTFRAIDDFLERSRALHARSHREEVVLADENDRQFVERRPDSAPRGTRPD